MVTGRQGHGGVSSCLVMTPMPGLVEEQKYSISWYDAVGVWARGKFSKVRPLLDLETHLLLYQQEDGKGETCGERSEVCGQDFPRGCGLDETDH